MTDTPDQKARLDIDTNFRASGWIVRDQDDLVPEPPARVGIKGPEASAHTSA